MLSKKDKKKWLKALRSGEYRQGQRKLIHITSRGNINYCCLGVACAIGIAKHSPSISDGELCTDEFIPEHQLKLATMNDSGLSFKKIADYIEENL